MSLTLQGAKNSMPDPSAWGAQIDHWDNIATMVQKSPTAVGVVSGLGYLAHVMRSEDVRSKRKIVASVLLCVFTGTGCYWLLQGLGFPASLAAPVSLFVGSTCDAGYTALTDRALSIAKGNSDEAG
jgi:hypothetical protein